MNPLAKANGKMPSNPSMMTVFHGLFSCSPTFPPPHSPQANTTPAIDAESVRSQSLRFIHLLNEVIPVLIPMIRLA
jgi:hypothetical protein